jgi:hypothetical protein
MPINRHPAWTWPEFGRPGKGILMNRSRWSLAAVIGAGGLAAAIMATTPALGVNSSTASGSTVKIVSATQPATVVVANSIQTIVTLTVPAGHWLISSKLCADSVPATAATNTMIGCAITKGGNPPLLDNTIVNIPKTAANTSAGVVDLSAVIKLLSPATIVVKCADFNTQVQTHNAVLTAIGG